LPWGQSGTVVEPPGASRLKLPKRRIRRWCVSDTLEKRRGKRDAWG